MVVVRMSPLWREYKILLTPNVHGSSMSYCKDVCPNIFQQSCVNAFPSPYQTLQCDCTQRAWLTCVLLKRRVSKNLLSTSFNVHVSMHFPLLIRLYNVTAASLNLNSFFNSWPVTEPMSPPWPCCWGCLVPSSPLPEAHSTTAKPWRKACSTSKLKGPGRSLPASE